MTSEKSVCKLETKGTWRRERETKMEIRQKSNRMKRSGHKHIQPYMLIVSGERERERKEKKKETELPNVNNRNCNALEANVYVNIIWINIYKVVFISTNVRSVDCIYAMCVWAITHAHGNVWFEVFFLGLASVNTNLTPILFAYDSSVIDVHRWGFKAQIKKL